MTNPNSDIKTMDSISFGEYMSLIANNSDINFILLDTELKIVALNERVKQQFSKYSNKSIQEGMSLFDISPEENIENLKAITKKVLEGSTETSISRVKSGNESEKIVSSTFKPAFDSDGQIKGILISSSDITILKQQEAEKTALEKNIDFEKENLKALINNSKSLIFSFDREFKLLTFNKAFENHSKALFGIIPKVGDAFLEYERGSDRTERFKLYTKRVFNGEPYSVVDHTYEPTERWTEIAFNPIIEKGKVVGIACFSSDITERKLFEKTLISSQNRLKRAQEIAHLGNWELSFRTNSARWSDEAYKIYGITSHNFDHTFESWISFIHPEDLDDVMAIIERGKQTLEGYSMYHRIIRPDGSIRYIYSETHFELDNNGQPIGVHGISQDITDRRINEMKLQDLLKKSNDQNRWLNNFTHIVSHNIRSHNSNISGIVSLLENTKDQEEFDQLIGLLKNSTDKLGETIKNLSEYIVLQSNSDKQYKSINIHDEINKTCTVISQLIADTGTEIINNADKNLSMQLVPAYIESILLNLLSNAIKYRSIDRQPIVKISNTKVNSFQCLRIEDNGMGIDLNKHKDAVFGMFQTFHGNKDAVGFGLFITKNQIEAMDGKIEIESTPGKGTIFNIYLHEKS